MRMLGIDFGTARIGLAISDDKRSFSLPLNTVEGSKNLEHAIDRIIKTISNRLHEIDVIVVGHPILLSGMEGDMAKMVSTFASKLEKRLSIKVVLLDERMTSAQVNNELKEIGLSRKRRTEIADEAAACLILQTYIDKLCMENQNQVIT